MQLWLHARRDATIPPICFAADDSMTITRVPRAKRLVGVLADIAHAQTRLYPSLLLFINATLVDTIDDPPVCSFPGSDAGGSPSPLPNRSASQAPRAGSKSANSPQGHKAPAENKSPRAVSSAAPKDRVGSRLSFSSQSRRSSTSQSALSCRDAQVRPTPECKLYATPCKLRRLCMCDVGRVSRPLNRCYTRIRWGIPNQADTPARSSIVVSTYTCANRIIV